MSEVIRPGLANLVIPRVNQEDAMTEETIKTSNELSAERTDTSPPPGSITCRSTLRISAPILPAICLNGLQPTSLILYDGATHQARPPFAATSRHSFTPSRVLPQRRPHASNLNRAPSLWTSACPGCGRALIVTWVCGIVPVHNHQRPTVLQLCALHVSTVPAQRLEHQTNRPRLAANHRLA